MSCVLLDPNVRISQKALEDGDVGGACLNWTETAGIECPEAMDRIRFFECAGIITNAAESVWKTVRWEYARQRVNTASLNSRAEFVVDAHDLHANMPIAVAHGFCSWELVAAAGFDTDTGRELPAPLLWATPLESPADARGFSPAGLSADGGVSCSEWGLVVVELAWERAARRFQSSAALSKYW